MEESLRIDKEYKASIEAEKIILILAATKRKNKSWKQKGRAEITSSKISSRNYADDFNRWAYLSS